MTDNKDVNSDIQPSNTLEQADTNVTPPDENLNSTNTPDKTKMKINHSPKKSGSLMVSGLAVAIAVTSLGTSGWLYLKSLESNVDAQVSELISQNNALSTKINQLTSQLNQVSNLTKQALTQTSSATQAQAANAEKITETTKQLSVIQSKLDTLSSVSKEDWQLAEAQYLIRLANQRLLLEKDHTNALALLQNADNILADMEDPILFDTRKAIAKDIQSLKSVGAFDLEGFYLQLNALYDSVATLPQFEPSKEWQKTEEPSMTEAPSSTVSASEIADSFWQGLKSLIVINYDRKPIKALLPPAEYQELVTGVQLQIEVAQVALVKGEKTVYQSALAKVADAIANYFDVEAKATSAFLTSLTALQQVNPDQKLPLPRASLSAIKTLMGQWNASSQGNSIQDLTTATSPPESNDEAKTSNTQADKSTVEQASPATDSAPAAPKPVDKDIRSEGVSA
ncbi:uroporphyrinogen-III C-methyltransferase [Marinomonas mediterranea]|jgi:Uncharacterized enzyme of heme biosynthesis|uniref:HemX domain protein n=1 Tax=Marinomonas mediterranea (strain ATCC 700492 / JCM 21426 / NBRC 103028 / MMB-1) TaxID=717774 RepID=F2K0T5_MARM1|nr:uroporphyrinogen-III C-methyltransferase [Marinomonas mediterranea]ADZ92177.1 hemX domain protein [Marinomonas mediterranea MMB-1]WCN18239.1 heme biosynthesis protein HemY [Marinomonas mediterranea MMB-1]